jgi:hypothetical protein
MLISDEKSGPFVAGTDGRSSGWVALTRVFQQDSDCQLSYPDRNDGSAAYPGIAVRLCCLTACLPSYGEAHRGVQKNETPSAALTRVARTADPQRRSCATTAASV